MSLQALGHTVRLMPPAYVKPYVKRQKNDAADGYCQRKNHFEDALDHEEHNQKEREGEKSKEEHADDHREYKRQAAARQTVPAFTSGSFLNHDNW